MTWRDKYPVHPAANVFPMMGDDELATLGEDIKANGCKAPLVVWYPSSKSKRTEGQLLDGRNRLEAAERIELEAFEVELEHVFGGDPVILVKALNLHRRHLLKSEQAAAIVALAKMQAEQPTEKLGHDGPVCPSGDARSYTDGVMKCRHDGCTKSFEGELPPDWAATAWHCGLIQTAWCPEHKGPVEAAWKRMDKGGRGKKNKVKAKALEINATLPKGQQVSERTIKRELAKAEGRTPRPRKLALESAIEALATQLAKLTMPEITAHIDQLKARIGELKEITAPRGRG